MAILISPAPDFDDAWAEPLALPGDLRPYTASQPLFCTNALCLKTFSSETSTPDAPCMDCGQRLATRTLGELRVLPADTRMWKMRYASNDKESYFTSLVLSGAEKDSIHRPEICLIAQGYAIVNERVASFELPAGDSISVKILDLKKGNRTANESIYAYWFFQAGRQTPYHARRVVLSTLDGILQNAWTPWAYIAVHTANIPDTALREERLMTFLQTLHTKIEIELERGSAQ